MEQDSEIKAEREMNNVIEFKCKVVIALDNKIIITLLELHEIRL